MSTMKLTSDTEGNLVPGVPRGNASGGHSATDGHQLVCLLRRPAGGMVRLWRCGPEEPVNKQMRDEYGTAITTQRTDSWATEQARSRVHRATTHRDEMRERHDAAVREEA